MEWRVFKMKKTAAEAAFLRKCGLSGQMPNWLLNRWLPVGELNERY
jgi:hypothetical protein